MQVFPIGVVRSLVHARKQMPAFGAPARIEVYRDYEEGLLRFEKHSHVWVLAWLDRAERNVLQVTPRGVADPGPAGLHGVFAVRSPARPNPVGLTATRVTRVAGNAIEVDRLDFLDGTPVLDLKPYFVSRDLIFSANNAPVGKPSGRPALRDSLIAQAAHFHGELCGDLAVTVRILEHFRFEVLGLEEWDGAQFTVPLGRPCLIDAVMGITRASPGRRNLVFHEDDRSLTVAAQTRGDYRILAPAEAEFSSTLDAPQESVFLFQPRQSQVILGADADLRPDHHR